MNRSRCKPHTSNHITTRTGASQPLYCITSCSHSTQPLFMHANQKKGQSTAGSRIACNHHRANQHHSNHERHTQTVDTHDSQHAGKPKTLQPLTPLFKKAAAGCCPSTHNRIMDAICNGPLYLAQLKTAVPYPNASERFGACEPHCCAACTYTHNQSISGTHCTLPLKSTAPNCAVVAACVVRTTAAEPVHHSTTVLPPAVPAYCLWTTQITLGKSGSANLHDRAIGDDRALAHNDHSITDRDTLRRHDMCHGQDSPVINLWSLQG